MPRYDVECLKCRHEFIAISKIKDREEVLCERCNAATKIVIKSSSGKGWFKPHWNEHLEYEPVFVESKKHLKELCLKNNVTSRALGDVRNITEI